MSRSLIRKIAFGTGGAVAVVALIGAAGIAYLSWTEWRRAEQIRARIREDSRTHDRPLNPQIADEISIEGDATKALAPVRAPQGEAEVLSFVSMPSFSTWRAVSISLSPSGTTAQGKVVSADQSGSLTQLTFSDVRSFSAPKAAFLRAARELDATTDGWPGSGDSLCMDGTPVAFERIRSGRVTSGWGNADCDKHYAAVREIVFAFLRRYAPDSVMPRTGSGTSTPHRAPRDPAP
jgi:hypothetical protein